MFGHDRNVSACCEGFFAARDNDATDGFVGIKDFQGGAQFVHQISVQGVQSLGTIEGDDANFAAFDADFNVFVGQNNSPIGC